MLIHILIFAAMCCVAVSEVVRAPLHVSPPLPPQGYEAFQLWGCNDVNAPGDYTIVCTGNEQIFISSSNVVVLVAGGMVSQLHISGSSANVTVFAWNTSFTDEITVHCPDASALSAQRLSLTLHSCLVTGFNALMLACHGYRNSSFAWFNTTVRVSSSVFIHRPTVFSGLHGTDMVFLECNITVDAGGMSAIPRGTMLLAVHEDYPMVDTSIRLIRSTFYVVQMQTLEYETNLLCVIFVRQNGVARNVLVVVDSCHVTILASTIQTAIVHFNTGAVPSASGLLTGADIVIHNLTTSLRSCGYSTVARIFSIYVADSNISISNISANIFTVPTLLQQEGKATFRTASVLGLNLPMISTSAIHFDRVRVVAFVTAGDDATNTNTSQHNKVSCGCHMLILSNASFVRLHAEDVQLHCTLSNGVFRGGLTKSYGAVGAFLITTDQGDPNRFSDSTLHVRNGRIVALLEVVCSALLALFGVAVVSGGVPLVNITGLIEGSDTVLGEGTLTLLPGSFAFPVITILSLYGQPQKASSVAGCRFTVRDSTAINSGRLDVPTLMIAAVSVNLGSIESTKIEVANIDLPTRSFGLVVCVAMLSLVQECSLVDSEIVVNGSTNSVSSVSSTGVLATTRVALVGALGVFVFTRTRMVVHNLNFVCYVVNVDYTAAPGRQLFAAMMRLDSSSNVSFTGACTFRNCTKVFASNVVWAARANSPSQWLPQVAVSCRTAWDGDRMRGTDVNAFSSSIVQEIDAAAAGIGSSRAAVVCGAPKFVPFFTATRTLPCSNLRGELTPWQPLPPLTVSAIVANGGVASLLMLLPREVVDPDESNEWLRDGSVRASWGTVVAVRVVSPVSVQLDVRAPVGVQGSSPNIVLAVDVSTRLFGCVGNTGYVRGSLVVLGANVSTSRVIVSSSRLVSTSVSAGATLLGGGASLGYSMSRSRVLLSLIDCDYGDGAPLPWTDSPFQTLIGDDDARYLRGAAVANALLVYVLCSAVLVAALALQLRRRRQGSRRALQVCASRALDVSRMPATSLLFFATWQSSTVSSACAVVSGASWAATGSDFFLCVVCLAAMVAPIGWFSWKLLGPQFDCIAVSKPLRSRQTSSSGGVKAKLLSLKRRLLHEEVSWRCGPKTCTSFLLRYGPLFEMYTKHHYFTLIEMTASIVAGIIGGIRPVSALGCDVLQYTLLVLNAIMLVLYVWLRPQVSLLDRLVCCISASIQVLASVFVVLSVDVVLELVEAQFYLSIAVLLPQWAWFFWRRLQYIRAYLGLCALTPLEAPNGHTSDDISVRHRSPNYDKASRHQQLKGKPQSHDDMEPVAASLNTTSKHKPAPASSNASLVSLIETICASEKCRSTEVLKRSVLI